MSRYQPLANFLASKKRMSGKQPLPRSNPAWALLCRAVVELLEEVRLLMHPFVACELALGNLRDWGSTVSMLRALPRAKVATESELFALIGNEGLAGSGIGFVDARLPAACRPMQPARLWTRDRRLDARSEILGLAWRSS